MAGFRARSRSRLRRAASSMRVRRVPSPRAMSRRRSGSPTRCFVRWRAAAASCRRGGRGTWDGGEGVVREFEALAPMEMTLLTERRRHGPAGTAGGTDGKSGANLLNGQSLESKATVRLAGGDVLRIETPGGGGWGKGEKV